MGLAFSEIADAVLLTQNKLIQRGAFVDMQTDLQDHVAVREMWQGRKKVFEGGENWEYEVQMDHNHSARAVGLYEQDGSSLHDTMVKGEIPPRHVNAHYLFDLREKAFQRGGTAIVDLIKTKYVAMMVSFYEYLEEILWSKPTDSTDLKTPYGLTYWVVKNATEGFNGADPSGFAAGRGGILSSTYTRYKNYTGTYAGAAGISKTDLLRKMRRAHRKTKFRSPVSHATPNINMGNGVYTNDTVIGIMEEILEDQNMNLGNDLASKDGKTLFKGTPVTYAPYLDNDTQNPVYMLDWKHLGIGVMAGWENNLGAPYMVPGKHLVRRVDLDATLNMVGTEIRRQSVFYDSTA
jgi:hypothetical protein